MHAPFEVRIGGDGDYALDMDGASAWGWHSMNCTPSGMQGAIWVMFTQTLICNDKVNDGAYLAVETNFPRARSPTSATPKARPRSPGRS